MVTRRGFFGALAAMAAAAVVGVKLPTTKQVDVTLSEADVAALPTVEGWTAGESFEVGDIFTIEGIHAYNPLTMQMTDHLQAFVVTEKADSRATAILSCQPRFVYSRGAAEAVAPLMQPLKVGHTIPMAVEWKAPENRRRRWRALSMSGGPPVLSGPSSTQTGPTT